MNAQRGAVLMVGLVFLLLLTLLATSSMQNATLQERMAGSQARRDASFQAAEAALHAGEARVSSPGFSQERCTGLATCLPPPEALTLSTEGTGGASGVIWRATPSGFVGIQYLGESTGAIEDGDAQQPPKLYRVTAIGLQGTARTVLESVHTDEKRILWRQRL
ncbi:pilus assembly PilX family protein [Pseudomonas sp. Pseu.R1]|uniref:pilus assembly PilX family protein n=1 Tax=Pseudomonas sp. Pseu.R1 TaxID=3379818 RepID=UPI003B951E0B